MSIGTMPANDLAALTVRGEYMPTVGVAAKYVFAVQNIGLNTQDDYVVKLLNKAGSVLVTKAGEAIGPNECKLFEFDYTPTLAEDTELYCVVEFSGDENVDNNTSRSIPVKIQPEGQFAIAVGDGETMAYFPINLFSRSSVQQSIYYAYELGANAGKINAIMYKASFEDYYEYPDVKVYICETERNNFSDKSWIDVSEMTKIYDGKLEIPSIGVSEWKINLDTPFEYNGGNVAIYVHMSGNNTAVRQNFFYCTNYAGSDRDLSYTANYEDIDPENPPTGSCGWYVPNVSFFIEFDGMGGINGQITDIAGEPVPNVTVSLSNTKLYTTTDENGCYQFPHLTPGIYTVLIKETNDFEAFTTTSVVEADVETSVNVSLIPKSKVAIVGKITRSDNGNAIEGATVAVTGVAQYSVTSDNEGFYTIENVYANYDYELSVSCPGFAPFSAVLSVADDDIVKNVALDEKPNPVQLLKAENTDGTIKVSWLKPNSIPEKDFRYDSNIRMSQLGLSGEYPNGLMGSVHRTPSELYEISWFLANDGMQHPIVDLYILDLDADGMPSSKILYKAIAVANVDDHWNTYVLDSPLKAPNGFMVAVSNAYGFVGLGVASSNAGYPFVEKSNFYTENYNNGVFIPIEDAGYRMNFMIRATGIDLQSEPGESQSRISHYSVYRFVDGQAQSEWTSLGDVTETEYDDNSWASLSQGVYYYAAKAHYENLVSVASISNMMPKDMTATVTVNISTNTEDPVSGATVVLTNQDGNADHIYSATSQDESVSLAEVWKGMYDVVVSLDGFDDYKLEGVEISADKTLEVVMKESVPTPYGLRIEPVAENPYNVIFSWNNEQDIAFWDDMESYQDFIIDNIGSYTLVDLDQLPTWYIAYSPTGAYQFPNNGYIGSYIVMNPYASEPAMTGLVTPYSGQKVLACVDANNSYGPGRNDDWLILPQLEIKNDMVLKFFAQSAGSQYAPERLRVGVSEDGVDTDSFVFINDGDYIEVPYEWTEYKFDLKDYVGSKVHIAINCVSSNSFILLIDDIFVGTEFNDVHSTLGISKVSPRRTGSFINYTVYLNDEEIAETKDSNYEFTDLVEGVSYTAGVKAVYSTGESEIVYTQPFSINLSGIEEADVDALNLYPNPFIDEIRINNPQDIRRVEITALNGQTVMSEELCGRASIQTGHLSAGFYLVVVETYSGNRTVFKMLKK